MILKSVLVLLIVHKLKVTRAEGCGPPPVVEHTKPIEGTFPLNHKLRYECVTGFVRKAGTSNRITCNIIASQYVWHTGLPLTCIAKPFAITEPKVVLPKTTPKPIEYIKTSTGRPPSTIAQNSTHATTSGKPHTTHTSLAPKAVSVATIRATSKSITFPIVTTTTTTAAWEEEETTGVNVKPPSTVSYDRLSPSPPHSFIIDLQDFTTNPAFYNQSAVVSGSVSAVFILLAVGLLLIFTKKALPWQQRRNTTDRPATYRRVAVGTTSHANTNPSCGISLSEQEASDGPDPAP
ncbi:interleukin-15 receptor subunit alpha isoform X2 [Clupea harengus]|uniref:Interleukin-15 receptor subunit alpha isoform X2 n=1 Tax=Clupea harengus TaxID=7950 RepID=A0A8M1KPG6_CLUHA|nr:interleukin-15 receptor subunit alpha isoform X2 [Clupea harengus]